MSTPNSNIHGGEKSDDLGHRSTQVNSYDETIGKTNKGKNKKDIPFCGVSKLIITQEQIEMEDQGPRVSSAKIHGEFQDAGQGLIRTAFDIDIRLQWDLDETRSHV